MKSITQGPCTEFEVGEKIKVVSAGTGEYKNTYKGYVGMVGEIVIDASSQNKIALMSNGDKKFFIGCVLENIIPEKSNLDDLFEENKRLLEENVKQAEAIKELRSNIRDLEEELEHERDSVTAALT